ncbi:uncharacterized protein LOC133390651 [Rhineura floridana]|uniref:uncharacterized protein LOC133390651 n=1 Tax=Rhineura floridana TaxID=261503 RepID=UPI002AC82255|nr:uncharacterized protein LOC133390651 [Rhineura floridana]XP_061495668.1 uncharacterized protein LOC133390651 [Rhineura floridana]XP_061495669.1 uncharacterized protein LOC133390651 [Rhineura floridana]XP_061495670.1 uncharacterized protein LOC133390651 [Rhineura floridana]XP_061495671.1 uncharacterized protein LOC133390651 [Rhineura floridana]XP_061495672.1 uncharacterized protein LOC133390651 [Rhineura floridana]
MKYFMALTRLDALETCPDSTQMVSDGPVAPPVPIAAIGTGGEVATPQTGVTSTAVVDCPVAGLAAPLVGTGCWTGREQTRILICGHSMIFWAARRAARSSMGSQLGLSHWATVQWLGRRGMHWEGLLPTLFQQDVVRTTPHVVVIHLGGNDLGLLQGKALRVQACKDMQVIRQRWPSVRLLWSDLLPRRVWRGVWNPWALDRARKKVNRHIRLALLGHGDLAIPHPHIQHSEVELYRADGVHLSDAGNDFFLKDLQRCLREVLLGSGVKGD